MNGCGANPVRSWLAAAVTGGAVALALAACASGPPDGVDGDLTDRWGALAEPVSFVPDADVCHRDGYRPTAPLADYRPVPCDQPHLTETVHVGTFAERAAERENPPAADSGAHRAAYAECERRVADHLGADFREGRLWLGVSLPSAAAWSGGARWFRCELMEVESVYGDPVERTSSLAGALSDDSDLRLRCYRVSVDDGDVREMNPVSCDKSHEAEFVGAWRAPDGAYPDHADEDAEARVYEGCREQVAEYVDVPVDGDLIYRTGTIADWMSEQDWAAGDRAFRCYLWLPDRELTRSLAGAGTEALPVRTE
jgi:hypothetical protein